MLFPFSEIRQRAALDGRLPDRNNKDGEPQALTTHLAPHAGHFANKDGENPELFLEKQHSSSGMKRKKALTFQT
jgi:hypothetical protein